MAKTPRQPRARAARSLLAVLLGLGTVALGLALPATPAHAQAVRGADLTALSPLFPPDNWWNVDISGAPLDPQSASYINFIGVTRGLHPDFGGDDPDTTNGIFGMVYIVVPATQPLVPVTFVEFGDQSDPGVQGRPAGYPIPIEARTQPKWIEGGNPGGGASGDHHMLLVDKDNRLLYELYHAHWTGSRWEAGSGAVFSLDSNFRRPDTWTSADAAGLAILPGLIRYDEAFRAAPIQHAFRFTVRSTDGYVYPASHEAGDTTGAPPMGLRLRLKASKNITGYTPEVQRIFQAMKTYGLIVADNGSDLYIQGTYDTRWNNDVLNPAFGSLKGSDFEVVDRGWRPAVEDATGPLDFYTLTPCRLLDTRQPFSPSGAPPLWPGLWRVLQTAGRCGIPASARALSVNVTVVTPGGTGNARLFAGDAEPPGTSSISFKTGTTRANNAVIKLSGSGTATLSLLNSAGLPLQMIVDVNGYFQ